MNKFEIGANSIAFITEENDLIIDKTFMLSIHLDEETGEYTVSAHKVDCENLIGKACDIAGDIIGEITIK